MRLLQTGEDFMQCNDCGRVLDESPNEANLMPCPLCGSTRRAINISVVEEIKFKEQIEKAGR